MFGAYGVRATGFDHPTFDVGCQARKICSLKLKKLKNVKKVLDIQAILRAAP